MKDFKPRIFEALIDEKGVDDGGVASFTFTVSQLVKGKLYKEADRSRYDENGRNSKPFFVDDNGCSRNIESMLKRNLIKEIH